MEVTEILKFLKEIKKNNTREWLSENEKWYKEIRTLRDNVAQQFIDLITKVDSRASIFRPSDVTYRLMRDTRFSQDKTPYKTHIGIFVCPPLGKKSLLAGYYLHLEPGNSFICGGNYCLPTKMLGLIRADIRDNIEEYIELVEGKEFKQFFPTVGMNPLKTAPKGFEKDWEYIDYVRPREFGIEQPLPDSFFRKKDAIAQLLPQIEQIKKYNDFINYSLEESGLPLMREGRK